MTREEAIEILKGAIKKPNTKDGYLGQALDMAIKALEQEPCDDVVSRQAVNTLIDELARAISDERCCVSRGRSTATIIRDIYHLPSVNSQPKTGHWKSFTHSAYHGIDDDGEPIWREFKVYHCSECYRKAVKKENYCPHCGAKMVEPQESEDKE